MLQKINLRKDCLKKIYLIFTTNLRKAIRNRGKINTKKLYKIFIIK